MAEPVNVTVDARPMPKAGVDPDVKLPPSVARAAAAAEALHAQAYAPPVAETPQNSGSVAEPPAQPNPNLPPNPQPPQPQPELPPPPPPPQPPPAPQPQLAPQPAPDDLTARAPFDQSIGAEGYYHRFISMQGRWRSAQEQLDAMRSEVAQIGDELIRTQQMIANAPPPPYQNGHATAPKPPVTQLVTPQDEQQFGTEVIDLVRRAARETIAPELQALRGENEQLHRQLQRTGKQTVFSILDERIPNWRTVNNDPAFKRWLSLPDVYSGGIRQQLLNAAVAAADAPRVVAFFNGFIREATQRQPDQPQPAPAPAVSPPAARQPSLSLDTLAAPGRARPAAGEPPAAVDKPIYTRAQIRLFYADVRRGVYGGREAEKTAIERDIFAAQQEGRVR